MTSGIFTAFEPAVCAVTIGMTADSVQVINTIGVRRQDRNALTHDNLSAICLGIIEWWNDHLAPEICSNVQLRQVEARKLTTRDDLQVIETPSVPSFGLITTAQMSNNVALVASFRSGFAGRSRRGRNYVVGIPKAACSGSFVSGDYADGIENAYDSLTSVLLSVAPVFEHVVLSRFTDNVQRELGVATLVEDYVVDRRLDTQRRRLPKPA